MGAAVGAVAGGGGGWPRVGWWVRGLAVGGAGRGWGGAGPPAAPAARARTGSDAGPVAGLSRDLASGIIGDLAAGLVAGISLALCVCVCVFFLFLGRCGSICTSGHPTPPK